MKSAPIQMFRMAGIVAASVTPWTAAHTQAVRFRAEARLVEVYATILDHKGHYVDDISRDQFRVADDGKLQSIVAFENNATPLSCALLLDTTASMDRALPVVKNATLKLVDEFRASDSIAIYAFSSALVTLQDFTSDKMAAKRAVMRTRPFGRTALFNAIAEVAHHLGARAGKKALVVLTDGDDNESALDLETAMSRARRVGMPVYAIALGEAQRSTALSAQLRKLATLSGGKCFTGTNSRDIERIFDAISIDLKHTYLLAYKPPGLPSTPAWRTISVFVDGPERYRVRAREGYQAE